jgi:hypothetical protein
MGQCLRKITIAYAFLSMSVVGTAIMLLTGCDLHNPAAAQYINRHPQVFTNAKFIPRLNFCTSTVVRLSNGNVFFSNVDLGLIPNGRGVLELTSSGDVIRMHISAHKVAKDTSDNVYLATRGSIVKIAPNGKIITLAGRAVSDNEIWRDDDVDGFGENARFNGIENIAADRSGNVYVQESKMPYAHIRKITSAGNVTTVFKGTVSQRTNNWDINAFAVDGSGNIFLGTNGAIMKIDIHGTVELFAGDDSYDEENARDGQGIDARFGGFITSMALDAHDNLYTTSTYSPIHKISLDGKVTTPWHDLPTASSNKTIISPGDLVDGDLIGNSISISSGIDVDADGDIYFVDCENNAFRKLTPDGKVLTIIRSSLEEQNRHVW